jgi:DNA-binding MarR family transcriptional regulator
MLSLLGEDQRKHVSAFRRANDAIRTCSGVPDLSASWVQVLLLIAETPAQTLAQIERESGLRTSSAQRILLALGQTDRFGKPGLGLVEDIIDPRHGTRKLYFLTVKGRSLMAEVLCALTGDRHPTYEVPTGGEFLTQFEFEQAARPASVNLKAFTPQEVITGKRALLRRGKKVGPHIVTFPLAPANSIIDEIEAWLEERGGIMHRLPTIAKPDGMAIVDLPIPEEQVHFHLRWG